VPPEEISRLQNQQSSRAKKTDSAAKGNEPSIIVGAKNLKLPERGSSVEANNDHESASHSSQTSKGMTSSQGSLYEPNKSSNRYYIKIIYWN